MGMAPGTDTTNKPKWWVGLIILAVIGMVLFVDLKTPIGGNIRFYSKWVECGGRPYEGHSLPFSNLRYYKRSPAVGLFRDYVRYYFCTPHDAELAGFSANVEHYEFPNLTDEERRDVKSRFNIY